MDTKRLFRTEMPAVLFSLAVAFASCSAPEPTPTPPPTWTIAVADDDASASRGTSLVLDADGFAHIIFTESSSLRPQCISNASGSWTTEYVDATPGDVEQGSCLKIDADGALHAAYYRPSTEQLVYATNSSGSWVADVVLDTNSSSSLFGNYASLAIGLDDNPRVAYLGIDDTTGFVNLRYATYDGADWSFAITDTNDGVGYHASLAIDADGYAHIGYFDDTNGRLKYVENSSGWSTPSAIDEPSGVTVGEYASMKTDSSRHVHVCYYDRTNTALKYATNASGEWVAQVIDSSSGAGQYGSLAIGTDGAIHISYYTQNGYDLKYATNASGSWTLQVVDSPGTPATNAGTYTSISLDADDRPHISYIDATNHSVKYAIMD